MGIETVDLSSIDLLTLIGSDTALRRVASTHGGEYCGSCPWCGGRDRFRVWPNHPHGKGRWWCRQCERSGDAIDYVQQLYRLPFPEALERLNVPINSSGRPRHRIRASEQLAPPGPVWQAQARGFTEECKAALWEPVGAQALAWLRRRGLDDEVIRVAGLGYNASDKWHEWHTWGLESREGTRGVWLPRGVVIPWEIDGKLWRVNIRRPVGEPKYIGPAGFSNALYNADALTTDRPAVLAEGELDALTLVQTAGDLVTPVATGSSGGARRVRWIARLALCPMVLVAFDADEPGQKAAHYWLEVLDNAKRWRPYWEDANAMIQGGADVRTWVAAGIAVQQSTPTITPQLTSEAEAEALLDRCTGNAGWAREWAELHDRWGVPCYGFDSWGEWAESTPEASGAGVVKQQFNDPPPTVPCRSFGTGEHRRFWRRMDEWDSGWICAICYPPPPGVEVQTWEIPA